jgi:hypothetical protein
MELGELKNFVREKAKEGKVVFMTCEGLRIVDIDEFVGQGAQGILYDLNRDKATTMTLASEDNLRWINDYAVAVVIEKLCEKK